MARLLNRTVEFEPKFGGQFLFGYFDEVPTQEEMARAYFGEGMPDDWADRPDLARAGDPPPTETGDGWRVLLGEAD